MKTKELKNYIAKVKKFNKGNNSLNVLDNILIENQNLITSNLDISFVKHFSELDPDLKTQINLLFLEKIVKKTKTENIDLNEIGKIKFVKNIFEYEVTDEEFPLYNIKEPKSFGTLCKEDLPKLKVASNFVGKDDLRPIMTGVLISKDKICATDAHLMYFDSHSSEIKEGVVIPIPVISLLNDEDYIFTQDSLTYSLKKDSEEVIFRAIEGKYPNFEAVIPKENPIVLEASKKEFLENLSLAEISSNKFTGKIILNLTEDKKSFVKSVEEDFKYSYKGEIEKCSHNSEEEFNIGFNSKFLLKIFRFLPDEISLEMSLPDRAAIFNKSFLVMPVKL